MLVQLAWRAEPSCRLVCSRFQFWPGLSSLRAFLVGAGPGIMPELPTSRMHHIDILEQIKSLDPVKARR